MRPPLILLLLLPLLAVLPDVSTRALADEWVPIDVSSAFVQDLASFAVGEHNRQAKAALLYKRVVSAESSAPNPIRYRLFIEAASNKAVGKYEAEVLEKGVRTLESFKPVAAR
ncbi:cysteine proteinase inhibitor 1-like [Aristolochia californica]|uniref:cysteine proteinase inhibitor 1-like n=1 Tax=Aristolochia californica TaxID=171875 RepID=UPI0035DED97E